MQEIWKDIPGYEGHYIVSNLGNIVSIKYGKYKILKPKNNCGYDEVILSKEGKQKFYKIHKLVAMVFLPNPSNLPCVCHKDETLINGRFNNSIGNLWWGTRSDNMRDKHSKGRDNNHFKSNHPHKGLFGKDHHSSKTVYQFSINGILIAEFGSTKEAERVLGIKYQNISDNCRGNRKTAGGFIFKY